MLYIKIKFVKLCINSIFPPMFNSSVLITDYRSSYSLILMAGGGDTLVPSCGCKGLFLTHASPF